MASLIVFLTIIGCFIICAFCVLLGILDNYGTGRIHEMRTKHRIGDLGYLQNAWAEFFQDEDLMREYHGMPYKVKFTYYGGTWYIVSSSELYWVYRGFRGIENEEPTYKSNWNYWRNDFKSMKHIMENHPNLINARKNLKAEDKKPRRAFD